MTAAENVRARSNVTTGVDRILSMPRVSVYRTASPIQSLANTSRTVPWDTMEYDTDGMWNLATPTLLTCRTEGLWQIGVMHSWASDPTASYRVLNLFKSTTQLAQSVTGEATNAGIAHSISWMAYLYAGETLECSAYAGVTLGWTASTSTSRANGFQACLISTP